jgi:hypothetical protein
MACNDLYCMRSFHKIRQTLIPHNSERCGKVPTWKRASCSRQWSSGEAWKQDVITIQGILRHLSSLYEKSWPQKVMKMKSLWLEGSWPFKGSWGRELVTPPISLWKISYTEHLVFPGRELSFMKFLAGKPTLRLSNWGDLKNYTPESSSIANHSDFLEICHERH